MYENVKKCNKYLNKIHTKLKKTLEMPLVVSDTKISTNMKSLFLKPTSSTETMTIIYDLINKFRGCDCI